MSNEIVKPKNAEMEYVPAGESSAIKLSADIVTRYISKPTKSGVMPSDRDIMTFMMLCKARSLNPFVADAWLVGYDGRNGAEFSIISSFAALLKRADANPEYDGLQSGLILEDTDGNVYDCEGQFAPPTATILGAWAVAHRKDRKFPMSARINAADYKKDNEFWKGKPALMIVKTAEAQALRKAFPLETQGMVTSEENQLETMEREASGRVVDRSESMVPDLSEKEPEAATEIDLFGQPVKELPGPDEQLDELAAAFFMEKADLLKEATRKGGLNPDDKYAIIEWARGQLS
jgi:phage recombination protein Bet